MEHTQNQLFEDFSYKSNDEKSWAVEDQPSNKLLEHGTRGLTDSDLLAVILSGMNNSTEVARTLLRAADNDLKTLSKFSIASLTKFEGITLKRATAITAAFEFGRRSCNDEPKPMTAIKSSETVFRMMQPLLGDLEYEEFWLITLNRANKVIKKHKISQGGLSGTVIDTRIILKKCIDDLACAAIFVHNHPSGNLQPSDADIKITQKLVKAGETLEIKVLDHVIAADVSYFSFADEGLI